jgi:hypothetical protein
MANIKKSEEEKFYPVMANMTMKMMGELDTIALDNNIARNEVIRIACGSIIKNKKKFNLK